MRLGVTIAAMCCLAGAAPLSLVADDAPQSQAEESESAPGGLETQLPDSGQLQSLLGTLIRHIGAQPGADDSAAQEDVAPPRPQSGSRITEHGNLLPPAPVSDEEIESQTPVEPARPQYESRRSSRSGRRSRFSERLLSRRMALIDRIRADAVASGDPEMAARSEQLGAFVLELHNVGLAGMAQRLGELGALGGGTSSAPAGTVEFPDTDFGAPAELGAPADLGAPESLPRDVPPELPPPALPE